MGISATRYKGYVVNLKKDLEDEDFKLFHELVDKYPKYDMWRHNRDKEDQKQTDRVTLVVDGMNGWFARLVYVEEYKDYIYPEVDYDDYQRLHLKHEVPKKIYNKLNTAYKLLYKKELDIENIEYTRFYLWG